MVILIFKRGKGHLRTQLVKADINCKMLPKQNLDPNVLLASANVCLYNV